ncbi:MAG: alanine--tRNA ligase [Gemmatimonadales bacterium]|nr:MAG: alanine--tRNA ligase [Gemmatimonadales bacterium]
MKASEIRRRFLDYFQLRGHELRPSAPLIPSDDPTLLFTNAGMVPFKRIFLGEESVPWDRAVTSQKCVRAGGKHNDLEQVGETARHHTFFEMLGNFSFGDYFKRDAIHFAWEFLTGELGLDPDRLYVTVHHSDDEAFALWTEVAGIDPARIYRLGDRDNFWQMADTGPCGPCSELHYDLRPEGQRGRPGHEEFEALGEAGVIMELWNLVFMQFDRDEEGTLHPLPAPSIDTGAGLERLAAVLQEVDSNYHTDLFMPLIERVAKVVDRPYDPDGPRGVSYRVLADHARAVTFLLADGVFPSNEGRGHVLRRILRRGVRHAWLLGRRESTLAAVVEVVIEQMAGAYPELRSRAEHILATTRAEEERFLETIEGGMDLFGALAPDRSGSPDREGDPGDPARISGADAFKLYDTFGFPLDLTQVMARERGYEVDVEGFERRLEEQRERSREDRRASGVAMDREEDLTKWTLPRGEAAQRWVGWEDSRVETEVVAFRGPDASRVGVILRDNPFYIEAGGQVSDRGVIAGEGWSVAVDEVRSVEGRTALFGSVDDPAAFADAAGRVPVPVEARVAGELRHDTERNHTATHLLHAALRDVLGEHVTQRGSLVTPDRLRFDFSHPGPLSDEEIRRIEAWVNRAIWEDHPVQWDIVGHREALERGAMALFGEKYGDEVRVVEIPGLSLELCGGTHLRHTSEAGLFRILKESGVASGVRRVEAVTGPRAFSVLEEAERELESLADRLRSTRENLPRRIDQILEEKEQLEALLAELREGGGGSGEDAIHEASVPTPSGGTATYRGLRLRVRDADDARAFGDRFREEASLAAAVVAARTPDDREALHAFVTDDLIGLGVRAGDLIRDVAAVTGGRGGGRPHMAQGGVEDEARVDDALREGEAVLRRLLGGDG